MTPATFKTSDNPAQAMLKARKLSQRLFGFGKDLFLRREQQLEAS
jgi:hypothetical protein